MKSIEEENKLPEEFKTAWCEALRSGKYRQGKTTLYNRLTDTFCCHGVAAVVCGGLSKSDVAGKQYIGDTPGTVPPPKNYPEILIDRNTKYGHEAVYRLSNMNDNGISFSEIADYIEQNL